MIDIVSNLSLTTPPYFMQMKEDMILTVCEDSYLRCRLPKAARMEKEEKICREPYVRVF